VREIRLLRSMRRGLETWHGRDGVTLAGERASQQGTSLARPLPVWAASLLVAKCWFPQSSDRSS
jgi:hypothetical protein